MGDNKAGAAFHEPSHGFAYLRFGSGIDAGSSFVQYQYRRIAEENSGYSQKLSLSHRDVFCVIAQNGVISQRHGVNEEVYSGGFSGRYDFFSRGLRFSVRYVFSYSAFKQPCVLSTIPKFFLRAALLILLVSLPSRNIWPPSVS